MYRPFRRNLVSLTLGFASAILLLQGCSPGTSKVDDCPAGKVCLRAGNGVEVLSLDPHKVSGVGDHRVLLDSMVGLTMADASDKVAPGAAERWETSADGLTWTFYLRDAVWSDGVPVTADDFVFSLRRILNPATAAEYASLLYPILGAQAVNEGRAALETLGVRAVTPRILEIRLEHPAPYLLQLAKHQTMYPVPKHVVEKHGNAWSRPEHYVSNGPYTIVSWKLGDRIKAVKNPRYWDAAKVCVDQISYYPTTDNITAERQVRNGELDMNADIQSNRIALLREQMPGYVRTHTYLGVSYLTYNNSVVALRDVRVRRALAMAIDREFITKKLMRGGQQPAYTFVPPGVANYQAVRPPEWAAWPFEKRQAEARRLLAEAGYGPGRPLKIEIKHRNSADPSLIMPAIQADWKSIGVEARLAQNEPQIAYAAYRARDFEVGDAAWVADYNDPMTFLYLMNSTTGAQNYGDYKNPAFDALLKKADNEPDAAVRAGYLAKAERIMLDDATIAPVFFYVNKNLVSPRVTGWVANLGDIHPTQFLCVKGAPKAPEA
ncbi:peptide ABC transporter substrate-binding protein [Phenylobacterium sp.]|jgi:oligopeptide transport system substrate-binding protein|uniref:peptide ABC transporter substrate-binding protein n=1 Tax=Phenylobacterium sp. TaxID=1871053 RepID=UPI0037C71296